MTDFEKDEEQRELIQGFVEEGREMLDDVEPQLVELETLADESGEVDPEIINTIFRLFHSLKGGAGFLDLDTVQKVTHEAETLLDMFRKGKGKLSSEHIDLLNRTCDFIRQLLNRVDDQLNDRGFEDDAVIVIEELKQTIESINRGSSPPGEKSKSDEASASIAESIDLSTIPDSFSVPTEEETPGDSFKLEITPEMVEQFTAEAQELLETAENALLSLENEPNNEEHLSSAFRAIHSFKGNSGFLGFSDLEKLSHHSETTLDQIRSGIIQSNSEIFTLLLEIIDFLRSAVNELARGEKPEIPALFGLISLLNEFAPDEAKDEAEDKAEEAALDEPEDEKPEQQPDEKPVEEAAESSVKSEPTAPSEDVVTADKSEAEKSTAAKTASAPMKKTQRQSVRVDVEKLDMLLNMVGELVIAEAMVAQNPDLKTIDANLDRFEKSAMHLNKITRDLQDISNSIRMIPLAGTFKRMIRLVRDLSQKAKKKVELEIIGEETEVDKTVIESITDPLVHIIRNSIDHGIEVPDERKETGKSAAGKLILEAKYVGGEVWIQVIDDGRGLNRDKIIAKAQEKGLLIGDGSDLRDEDVWLYIFKPGFSTADKITDVSGRGVGMDVVIRNIERIRGKVDIRSEAGVGTTVFLKLPLTLAIIDGMIIRVGKTKFTIPIMDIKESFLAQEENITKTMDGQEIVKLRDTLYPVVRLHELFNIETEVNNLSEGIIILVENEGKTACILVDELIGQQQIVIKALSQYVGDMDNISGCTILGDGEISLIIDIAGVINTAEGTVTA
jgi:two-component system chemotaxis sensor kinase CheA